jgi:hypothetical protein
MENNNNNAAVDLDSKGRPRFAQYDCNNNKYYMQIENAMKLADELMTGDEYIRPQKADFFMAKLKASDAWKSLNLVTRPIVELRWLQKWNEFKRSGMWPREAD